MEIARQKGRRTDEFIFAFIFVLFVFGRSLMVFVIDFPIRQDRLASQPSSLFFVDDYYSLWFDVIFMVETLFIVNFDVQLTTGGDLSFLTPF